jgi:hypothetical protein
MPHLWNKKKIAFLQPLFKCSDLNNIFNSENKSVHVSCFSSEKRFTGGIKGEIFLKVGKLMHPWTL